jgi:hypothetical protein
MRAFNIDLDEVNMIPPGQDAWHYIPVNREIPWLSADWENPTALDFKTEVLIPLRAESTMPAWSGQENYEGISPDLFQARLTRMATEFRKYLDNTGQLLDKAGVRLHFRGEHATMYTRMYLRGKVWPKIRYVTWE